MCTDVNRWLTLLATYRPNSCASSVALSRDSVRAVSFRTGLVAKRHSAWTDTSLRNGTSTLCVQFGLTGPVGRSGASISITSYSGMLPTWSENPIHSRPITTTTASIAPLLAKRPIDGTAAVARRLTHIVCAHDKEGTCKIIPTCPMGPYRPASAIRANATDFWCSAIPDSRASRV